MLDADEWFRFEAARRGNIFSTLASRDFACEILHHKSSMYLTSQTLKRFIKCRFRALRAKCEIGGIKFHALRSTR